MTKTPDLYVINFDCKSIISIELDFLTYSEGYNKEEIGLSDVILRLSIYDFDIASVGSYYSRRYNYILYSDILTNFKKWKLENQCD